MVRDDCILGHIACRVPLLFCVKAGVRYMKFRIEEIEIQWVLELRTVCCSNNLKHEQKIRGKSGFETRTSTQKSNNESRGRLLSAWSHARAVARSVLLWLVQ
jgi:hypothetical protein